MEDYHINIFYSEDDEGYIVDIPDLKIMLCLCRKTGSSVGRGVGSQGVFGAY